MLLEHEQELNDTRSPLDRFRKLPKKPLSVTDLISPAWCEMQYFYNLAKYGKVKRTPAMRQGSSVHKVLEEEVHVAVPVDVQTREDKFALRLWNIVQGLRTLRATGLTREMEVWGLVDGQVVNGIIDQLSYTCPDPTLQQVLLNGKNRGGKAAHSLEFGQTTLEAFLGSPINGSTLAASQPPNQPAVRSQVYVTDVKTRGNNFVPRDEASLRGTYMQLMFYRHFLIQLSSGQIPREEIFGRYRVDPVAGLSDSFISQIAGLDFANFDPSAVDPDAENTPPQSTPDVLDELTSHNTLTELWTLMMEEMALTIDNRTTNPGVSVILQAEYRKPSTGDIIGKKIFVHDDRKFEAYKADEMSWWRGERPTKGVEVEEAFKCRLCTFAENCDWRKSKVEESLRKVDRREIKVGQQAIVY